VPKTASDLAKLIKTGKLSPVIAIGGAERDGVKHAIFGIRRHVLNDGDTFNHDRFDALVTPLQNVLDCANTIPVMANLRLLEVESAEIFFKDDAKMLIGYFEDPAPFTVLVLVIKKIDLRAKITKTLDKKGWLFGFESPKSYEMPKTIEQSLKAAGLQMSTHAKALLTLYVGTDVAYLGQAIAKLKLLEKPRLDEADISQHILQSGGIDPFRLGRAIANFDQKESLKILMALEKADEVPLRIVGLIAWQLRQILQARADLDKGMALREIGQSLKLFGPRLESVLVAAKKAKFNLHAKRLGRICDLDEKLKSTSVPHWLWIERVIMQICPARN